MAAGQLRRVAEPRGAMLSPTHRRRRPRGWLALVPRFRDLLSSPQPHVSPEEAIVVLLYVVCERWEIESYRWRREKVVYIFKIPNSNQPRVQFWFTRFFLQRKKTILPFIKSIKSPFCPPSKNRILQERLDMDGCTKYDS